MELVLDPAALAGVIGMTALIGWALGRTQIGRPPASSHAFGALPPPLAAGTSAASGASGGVIEVHSPCQRRAFEERRAIFSDPVVLTDLQEEVFSIRQDERIFERGLEDTGLMVMLARGEGETCRYLGRSGQPTCPGPINGTCHHGGTCSVLGFHARQSASPDQAPGRSLAAH